MMLKTLKLFILINIFASSFLSVFADGYSCTVAPGNCPTGYSPLDQQISDGKINFSGLSGNELVRSIANTISRGKVLENGGDYKLTDRDRLCIKDVVKEVINVAYVNIGFGSTNAEASDVGVNLAAFSADGIYAYTPTFCFENSQVKQVPRPNVSDVLDGAANTNTANFYGCCPVNYNFMFADNVTSTGQMSLFNTELGSNPIAACCPNLSGNNSIIRDTDSLVSSPTGYPVKFKYENGTPKCFSKRAKDDYVEVAVGSTPIYYDTYRSKSNPGEWNNLEYSVYLEMVSKLASGVEETINSKVYGMVLGLPMGTNGQVVRNADLNELDPYYCKNAAVGACGEVDSKSTGVLICPGGTADACRLANGNYIYDASVFVDAGNPNIYQCKKCYQPGELIETFAGNSAKDGYVGFCVAGALEKRPLINGSVTDSLEYYLTDAANKPALASCKASGGIYTAIGCVDPSPLGIITGLIRISLGVVGGVALLQMVYVGILYQLGDEGKIKEARSRLIATITGVAVLIFSILILRIIGVNVLDILPVGAI